MNPPEDVSITSQTPNLKKEATETVVDKEYILVSETFPLARRKSEFSYPIKESDLQRIEEQITAIIPQARIFGALWPFAGGIAATAFFSLLGFWSLEHVPPKLWEVGFIVFFVSLVLGIIFWILDFREPNRLARSVEDTVGQLRAIRAQFEHGENVFGSDNS